MHLYVCTTIKIDLRDAQNTGWSGEEKEMDLGIIAKEDFLLYQ